MIRLVYHAGQLPIEYTWKERCAVGVRISDNDAATIVMLEHYIKEPSMTGETFNSEASEVHTHLNATDTAHRMAEIEKQYSRNNCGR